MPRRLPEPGGRVVVPGDLGGPHVDAGGRVGAAEGQVLAVGTAAVGHVAGLAVSFGFYCGSSGDACVHAAVVVVGIKAVSFQFGVRVAV